jgi:hypothetical protein
MAKKKTKETSVAKVPARREKGELPEVSKQTAAGFGEAP